MSQPYDKYKVPSSESSPLDVLIKMGAGGITLRAVDNFMLTLGFDWINMCWRDPRVTLESPDTSTGKFVVLGEDFVWEIWKPRLYLDSTKKPFMEYMKESGRHFFFKKCCLHKAQCTSYKWLSRNDVTLGLLFKADTPPNHSLMYVVTFI